MGSDEFLDLCKKVVREYTEEHLDKTDGKVDFDVYAVWSCKALQNSKALASTSLPCITEKKLSFQVGVDIGIGMMKRKQ